MYLFMLDLILLPYAPQTLTNTVRNRNKTMELLNTGEVNIVKDVGLEEFDFEISLPNESYSYLNIDFLGASVYITLLKKLKEKGDPFYFTVARPFNLRTITNVTFKKVTIENLQFIEDAKNGVDVVAKITLKEYKEYGTKYFQLGEDGVAYLDNTRLAMDTPTSFVVPTLLPSLSPISAITVGDEELFTLWDICQKNLGDGDRWEEIAELNDIPRNLWNNIPRGTVIRFE